MQGMAKPGLNKECAASPLMQRTEIGGDSALVSLVQGRKCLAHRKQR